MKTELTYQEQVLLIERELQRWAAAHRFTRDALPRDIQEIVDYIEAHLFEEGLSVATVRKGCRISNHNVSSRFRLLLGTSIYSHIEKRRMAAARALLHHEELPVYLISASVGYTHPESFSRAFRRCFGISPACHRESLLDLQQERRSG